MSFFSLLNQFNARNDLLITPNELKRRHIRDARRCFQEKKAALFYSKKQLQELRNQRLSALLLYAKSHSPWYKKTLAKINLKNFTVARLHELPTINKTILMDHWDDIVTNRKLSLALVENHLRRKNHEIDTLYLNGRYHVLSTGGTSGKRGIFIYDWDEWITFYLSFIRYPLYNHDRSGILTIHLDAKIVNLNVSNTATASFSLAQNFTPENQHLYFLPMATTPLNIVITRLQQIQPDVLYAAPSYIHRICQLVQKGELTIQPKFIFLLGEPLFELTKALIKNTWPQVHVVNNYGCCEGLTGLSCRTDSDEMHLNDDLCIAEPLDEQNQPVEAGILTSKLYLTNLYNYTLPLIRYENAEQMLFVNKSCDCGNVHQIIKAPASRPAYDFHFPGNIFVHHSLFLAPLLLNRNIQEYQVIQTVDGFDIKILINGAVDKQKLKEDICLRLRKVGLIEAQVNILEVPEITYLYSGKLNRFIALVGD